MNNDYIGKINPELTGERANLIDILKSTAKCYGLSDDETLNLIGIIPPNLCKSQCFFDKLTSKWRYEFGHPFIVNKQQILGTNMFHPVEKLILVLNCAIKRLNRLILNGYLKNLDNQRKHEDYLFEFAPILKIKEDVRATYEANGCKNKTIDWLIEPTGEPQILLEVKKRDKDFIEFISRFYQGESETNGGPPKPKHDPRILFKSITGKFYPNEPNKCLQGAWVRSLLKQNEMDLIEAFAELDHTKVHFIILGDFEEEAYILSIDDQIKRYVSNLFQLIESKKFII